MSKDNLDELLEDLYYQGESGQRTVGEIEWLELREDKARTIQAIKALIDRLCNEARAAELMEVLQMNGVHQGDWELSIRQRIVELEAALSKEEK